MAYILQVPTLQHITYVNVASLLWKNDCEVKKKITNILPELHDKQSTKEKHWSFVESKVRDKVSQLHIPKVCKTLLRDFVKYIGLELRDWTLYLHYHVISCTIDGSKAIKCIDYTQWTPHGKINTKKTAEKLLSSNDLALKDKYKIACTYCLGNEIEEIWQKFADNLKKIDNDNVKFCIINYWTCKMLRKECKNCLFLSKIEQYNKITVNNCSKHEFMFRWAVNCDNEAAVRYFWSQLSVEEKNQNLIDSIEEISGHWNGRGIMCFLLNQLNPDEIVQFLKRDSSYHVLQSLISDWLYCDFFIPTLLHVFGYLNNDKIIDLLLKTAEQVKRFPHSKYSNIFKDFWSSTSTDFRVKCLDHVGDRIKLSNVIQELSEGGDLDNIKLLLEEICVEVRKVILSQCISLLVKEKWDFFKIMVYEFISDDELISFKSICAKKLYVVYQLDFIDEKQWKLMDCVLWCFSTDQEVRNYKNKLISGPFIASKLTENLVNNGVKQLKSIDRILNWFSLNDIEIKTFKKDKLAIHSNVIKAIFQWISEDQFILIDILLNWCFSTKCERNFYKTQLPYNNDFTVFIKNSININNNIYLTCKILDWCFVDGTELIHLPCQCLYYVCDFLLTKREFKSAHQFVDKYCPKEKLNIFKSDLFSYYGMSLLSSYLKSCSKCCELIYQYSKDDSDKNVLYSFFDDTKGMDYCYFDGKDVEKLIQWFNLSSEKIHELKLGIKMDEEQVFKKDILQLLDKF